MIALWAGYGGMLGIPPAVRGAEETREGSHPPLQLSRIALTPLDGEERMRVCFAWGNH